MTFLLLVVLAYAFGSLPSGKIIGSYKGVDIQKHGSGNIGFANATRVLGWHYGLVVLVADVVKGYIPVAIASHYLNLPHLYLVGLAAIVGHISPVWLNFRGGKGVATGLGVLLAIDPFVALMGLAVYVLRISFLKKSAPSSVLAAWSLPIIAFIFNHQLVWFCLVLALLATWTHRENLATNKKRFIDVD